MVNLDKRSYRVEVIRPVWMPFNDVAYTIVESLVHKLGYPTTGPKAEKYAVMIASIIKAQFISRKIVVTPKRRLISPSLTPVVRNTNHLSLVPTDEDLAIHIPVNHLKKIKVGFDWPDKYSRHS